MTGSIIHLHPLIFFHAKVGMEEWKKIGDVKRDVDKRGCIFQKRYIYKENIYVKGSAPLKKRYMCKKRI
jgi:hypothetical protein